MTSVCSRGRPLPARSRRRRSGTSHSVSSAIGLAGSGRPAARTRAPAATSAPAASSATKMPQSMPTVVAGPLIEGLSNRRQISSTSTQAPASETITPSPPGRWKRLRWVRAHTR